MSFAARTSFVGRKMFVAIGVGSLLSAIGMLTPPTAEASDTLDPEFSIATRRCYTLLGKIQPGEMTSRVISQECAEPGQELAVPQGARALLLQAYDEADFKGTWQAYYGDAGPCDAEGYGIRDVGWILENKISSWGTHSHCSYVRGYTETDFRGECGEWWDLTNYPGAHFNDRINSFRVAAAYHRC